MSHVRPERLSHTAEAYLRERTAPGFKKRLNAIDELAETVTFKRTVVDVMDNKAAVGIALERSRSNGKITVRYETRDVTALNGTNYTGGAGTVTFMHGDKVAFIKIPLRDTDFEEGETSKIFKVVLLEGSIIRGQTRRM